MAMTDTVLFLVFLILLAILCLKIRKNKYTGQESVEYDALNAIQPGAERITASSSARPYDVFINHRGVDVKQTVALQLYNSIEEIGFQAFLDCKEMELGDSIPYSIKKAILSASVQIAIFSKGYAESAWCLDELTLMLRTKAKIIPVFYDVKPWELRHIEKGVYAKAFAKYKQKRRHLNKLEEWKEALRSVSLIKGFEISKHNHDLDKLCKTVVSAVVKEVDKMKSLDVPENPVGLDELVEDFERRFGQRREQKFNIVGIYGIGGSGKTTLAKQLFNQKRCDYDGSCFLFDVSEAYHKKELRSLQTKLVKDLLHLRNPPRFQSTDGGKSYIKSSLRSISFLRLLIVLDDVDHKDQLDALLDRASLNTDSLVIVTTRDKTVLVRAGITLCYQMKEMDQEHSRQLFCWHAFLQPYPATGYEDLIEKFVKECRGLPLSLRVLGGLVFGSTDHHYWQSLLDEVGKTLPEDIKCRIKISFDSLNNQQKQIFMDIACFFIGKPKSMAMRIWRASGWNAELALQTLKHKCLVEEVWRYWEEVDDDKFAFRMHDHLRDLGREMADELSSPRRLWQPRYLQTLDVSQFQNIQSKTIVRCLLSIFDSSVGVHITCFFGKPDNCAEISSALLWLQLDLKGCKHKNIPSWIPLKNVRCLRIVDGHLTRLWHKYEKAPSQLTELLLHKISLEECEKSLEMLNYVEKLVLQGNNTDESMLLEGMCLSKFLRKLTHLRNLVVRHFKLSGEVALGSSIKFTTLESPMTSLEKIEIGQEKDVIKISISGECCPGLSSLHLESMEKLIFVSLTGLRTLNCLDVRYCRELVTINGVCDLAKLAIFNICECPMLEYFITLSRMTCLERITIDGCQKLQYITGIEHLQRLKYLHLSGVPGLIWNCIYGLQRLPSVLTTVIGRAVYGATANLRGDLFSDLIGADPDSEIHINENGIPEVTLNQMPVSISAVIVCAVVQSNYGEIIQIPLPSSDSIESYIGEGEWIVTIVANTKSDWIPSVLFGAEIKKGCVVKVSTDDEEKALPIFKRIIGRLYQKPIMDYTDYAFH